MAGWLKRVIGGRGDADEREAGRRTAIDPVCGMQVDEEKAAATSVYKGTTYYFCAPGCKRSFDEDPEKYLHGGPEGGHPGSG